MVAYIQRPSEMDFVSHHDTKKPDGFSGLLGGRTSMANSVRASNNRCFLRQALCERDAPPCWGKSVALTQKSKRGDQHQHVHGPLSLAASKQASKSSLTTVALVTSSSPARNIVKLKVTFDSTFNPSSHHLPEVTRGSSQLSTVRLLAEICCMSNVHVPRLVVEAVVDDADSLSAVTRILHFSDMSMQ